MDHAFANRIKLENVFDQIYQLIHDTSIPVDEVEQKVKKLMVQGNIDLSNN